MTSTDFPSATPYAPIPHALILTHPASHVRLWGLLHYYWWNHQTYDTADLAQALDTTDRTIYRWLDAMATDGWIAYDRRPGTRKDGLGERITLYTSPGQSLPTSDTRIRGSAQPLTPGSEVPPTSDTRIRGSAQPLTPGSVTSDPGVRGAPDLAQQDAPKNTPQIRTQIPDSDPESPSPIPIPDGGPTGMDGWGREVLSDPVSPPPGPITNLETVALLRAIGVVSITKVAHLPPAQVAGVIAAARRKSEILDIASWVVAQLRKAPAIDPADTAALDRWLAALTPEQPNGHRPRPVGSRRGRAVAAQPAPDLPGGSALSDDELAAVLAEGEAYFQRRPAGDP